MTTPERLRRRQRFESLFIALLAGALVIVFIYFRGQDDAQERCFNNYFETQARVSQIRGDIVERESNATRRVIASALTAQTKGDLIKAREAYFRALKAIDHARETHPVPQFPEGVCN